MTIDVNKVIENLREVFDPEMPSVSVYDLGLIYNIEVNGDVVKITHTLTSPMCPFADFIIASIQEAALEDTGATDVEIDLTFDPPFTVEMVPEDTRLAMGWI